MAKMGRLSVAVLHENSIREARTVVETSGPLPNQGSAEIKLHGNWLGIDSGGSCLIRTSQIVQDLTRFRSLGQRNESMIALNLLAGISIPRSRVTTLPLVHHISISQ